MTAFFLLTGDAPPGGLRSDEPQHSLSIRLPRPDLDDLDAILRRATLFDAARRPTMRQLALELAAWRTPPTTPGTPDIARHRRRLAAFTRSNSQATTNAPWDGVAQQAFTRLSNRAKPIFDEIQGLGLESYSSSDWLRRIDPANRPIRSATSVGLQPADADGAVWIAGALSWGWQDVGSMYVTAAWVVAPFDAPPAVVGTWSVEFDPESIADLRRAEQTVDEWAAGTNGAIERLAVEAGRFASASPQAPCLDGAVAPNSPTSR